MGRRDPNLHLGRGLEALCWCRGEEDDECVTAGGFWGCFGEVIEIIPKLGLTHRELQPNQWDPALDGESEGNSSRQSCSGETSPISTALQHVCRMFSPAQPLPEVHRSVTKQMYLFFLFFFFFPLPFFLLVRKSLCSNCRQVGRCFLHNSPSYEMFMKHLPQISYASGLRSFDHFPSPSMCFLVCFAFCFRV